MGYQVGVVGLELGEVGSKVAEFSVSRSERSDEEVEKRLRIGITGLLQGFVAREVLTKL